MKYVTAFLLLLPSVPVLALPAGHYNMGPARRFTPASGEVRFISFSNGYVIDTKKGEPDLPHNLRLAENLTGNQYCIIQFTGPIEQNWFRRLEASGIRTFGYLPQYAVLARLDAGQKEYVSSLPFVNWVGLFQPAYKLELGLLGTTGTRRFSLLVTPTEDPAAVTRRIEELAGTVLQVMTSGYGTTVEFILDTEKIPDLARLQEVFWIQAWSEPTTCNNSAQWVAQTGWQPVAPPDTNLAARRVWKEGVRGQGVILSVHDTGLNTGHDMFRDPAKPVTPPGIWPDHRKVVAYKKYGTADASEGQYHGSHVAGTVAGNDSLPGGTTFYDGIAKDARLYFVDLTNGTSFVVSADLYPVWDTVHLGRGLPDSLRPVWQASGSWGYSNSSGTYLLQDASTDAYCWAHKDFLNIMAAGNESSTRRLRNPGIAKNVLTVGATNNGTGSNTIASFSSRGPTQDGRIKPNVMATGVDLNSAQAAPSTNGYSKMSGTSMATPSINGAVGLMRCYLQEGYYPSGTPEPHQKLNYNSAALLRAMAQVSADPNVSSYTIPSFDIGWGRVDVDSVLYFPGDTRRLLLVDDTFGLATGEYKEARFKVNSAIPLRVCLAWTDTAAAPNANPTLVNNLNLELISPAGVSYRGNQYSGGQSTPNPSAWDSLNVEECVRVNSPDTGYWTIKVYGQNVRTAQKQWFAWALTGDIAVRTGPPKDIAVTAILTPTGRIDSGSVVLPSATLHNLGTKDEEVFTWFRIGTTYLDTQTVLVLAGMNSTVSYRPWTADSVGTYLVRCSTAVEGDTAPSNDFLTDSVEVVPLTGIEENPVRPWRFSLEKPHPNPVLGSARIRFGLPEQARVRLCVYSATGTLVREIRLGILPAGFHQAIWDGRSHTGQVLSPGVYLIRMEANNFIATRKLILER